LGLFYNTTARVRWDMVAEAGPHSVGRATGKTFGTLIARLRHAGTACTRVAYYALPQNDLLFDLL